MAETPTTETTEPKKKPASAKKSMIYKKIDAETAKLFQQFKERANRKAFGRKIRDTEILGAAVRLLGSDHILALQEATYSEKDRLQMAHEEYQKANGRISLDQFIGKLIRGEITAVRKSSNPLDSKD